MVRCINIDWLELFCEEPATQPRDPDYFRGRAYDVNVREYGTPQYRQMFTISKNGNPLIEIRRIPYSLKSQGGIFKDNNCHIRLTNFACYLLDPIAILRQFLWVNDYKLVSISRVDICLDFLSFDNGLNPGTFLQRYAKGDYFKIHLSKIAPHGIEVSGANFEGHGTDGPYTREFNSWKWGAPSSAISVKLYNKTKELGEVHEKTYIRDQWQAAGLISQEDRKLMAHIRDLRYYIGQLTRNIKKAPLDQRNTMKIRMNEYKQQLQESLQKEKQVWRCEFSINSDIKGFVSGDKNDVDKAGKQRVYPLNLSVIETRAKCLFLFFVLAKRYFVFKQVKLTRNGTRQRKDRCPDYRPFIYYSDEAAYKPVRIVSNPAPSRMDKIIINKLRRIVDANNENPFLDEKQINSIIDTLQYFRQLYQFDELDKVTNLAMMFKERIIENDIADKEHLLSKITNLIIDVEKLNENYNV